MKKIITLLISISIIALLILLSSAKQSNNALTQIEKHYNIQLDSLDSQLHLLKNAVLKNNNAVLQTHFKHARKIYKDIEFLVEYHFAESAIKLNGPNLLEAKAQSPLEPTHPTGFQVLEELLWDDYNFDKNAIIYEIENIEFALNRLKETSKILELTESNVLDAVKLNLYRLITKGITGFDSPVALLGTEEAVYTINAMGSALQYFKNSFTVFDQILITQKYLQSYTGTFDDFNRAEFITKYVNPLCDELYYYQVNEKIPFAHSYLKGIPSNVPNMFSVGAFDTFYFAPENALHLSEEAILLGKKLFNDPRLAITNNRSCATCHNPKKAFTDGKKLNESIVDGKKLMRNTPTLINAALQPVQFYDSRINFLEDQAHEVITNEDEMGGNFKSIAERLKKDKEYRTLFQKVYGNTNITSRNINYAIAAYVRSLTSCFPRWDTQVRN